MLIITEGNLVSLNAEMREESQACSNEIKSLKARIRTAKRDLKNERKTVITPKWVFEETIRQCQSQIDNLTGRIDGMLNSSKVNPVRVGNIVINYKAYPKFCKKLGKLPWSLELTDTCLKVHYQTKTGGKGRLELIDLSKHFMDFKHIPVAVIREENC